MDTVYSELDTPARLTSQASTVHGTPFGRLTLGLPDDAPAGWKSSFNLNLSNNSLYRLAGCALGGRLFSFSGFQQQQLVQNAQPFEEETEFQRVYRSYVHINQLFPNAQSVGICCFFLVVLKYKWLARSRVLFPHCQDHPALQQLASCEKDKKKRQVVSMV